VLYIVRVTSEEVVSWVQCSVQEMKYVVCLIYS